MNDGLIFILKLDKIKKIEKDIVLTSHRKKFIDEWEIKKYLEQDNVFVVIEDTNYFIKEIENKKGKKTFLIFERVEEKEDYLQKKILKLNFLGCYEEVDEKELKKELENN